MGPFDETFDKKSKTKPKKVGPAKANKPGTSSMTRKTLLPYIENVDFLFTEKVSMSKIPKGIKNFCQVRDSNPRPSDSQTSKNPD